MPRFLLKRLCALLGVPLLLSACASGPDPERDGRLAWLAGCWRSVDGVNQETWTPLTSGLMFGHAVTVRESVLAGFEQSRIDLRQPQALYFAYPGGQGPVVFVEAPQDVLPEGADAQVTFENPEHDFPQRIRYMSTGRNALAATISQMDGSRPTSLSWKRCN